MICLLDDGDWRREVGVRGPHQHPQSILYECGCGCGATAATTTNAALFARDSLNQPLLFPTGYCGVTPFLLITCFLPHHDFLLLIHGKIDLFD